MNKNTANKMASIAAAIILWVYVVGEVNPPTTQTFAGIPVQLKNVEVLENSGLAIAGGTEYVVDVTVKGQRSDILKMTMQDIAASADLFGFVKGQNYVNVAVTIPERATLVEVRPPKVQILLEELVAVSKPVNIGFNNLPAGKEIGNLKTQPTDIEVSGAKSSVHSVHSVLGKIDMDNIGVGKPQKIQVEVKPANAGELTVNNVNASSRYADVSFVLMEVKEVPLTIKTIGNAGEDISVEQQAPEKIKIKGLPKDLAKVSELETEPVDLSTVSDGKAVEVKVMLPEGIQLSDKNPKIECRFSMKKTASKAILYSANEISVNNLPEEYQMTLSEGTITVKISGEEQVLEAVTKANLKLEVDATKVTEDTSSLPLTLVCDVKGMDKMTVEPEKISVSCVRNP